MTSTIRKTNRSGRPRFVLLIAALASLCISEGVGLQLLPLRSAVFASSMIEAPRLGSSDRSSQVPSGDQSASRKIEIAAPTANRSVIEQQSVRLLSHVLLVAFELPDEVSLTVPDYKTDFYRSSILASELTSRGPPKIS